METQDQNNSSCNWNPRHDKGTQNFIDEVHGKRSLQEMQKILSQVLLTYYKRCSQYK